MYNQNRLSRLLYALDSAIRDGDYLFRGLHVKLSINDSVRRVPNSRGGNNTRDDALLRDDHARSFARSIAMFQRDAVFTYRDYEHAKLNVEYIAPIPTIKPYIRTNSKLIAINIPYGSCIIREFARIYPGFNLWA